MAAQDTLPPHELAKEELDRLISWGHTQLDALRASTPDAATRRKIVVRDMLERLHTRWWGAVEKALSQVKPKASAGLRLPRRDSPLAAAFRSGVRAHAEQRITDAMAD